ncbi:MAG: hypothetical protein K2Q18_06050 [Bdellovibrionales bacterium]|nr:hypothetical protein [Bdellovibrionales bacterium]
MTTDEIHKLILELKEERINLYRDIIKHKEDIILELRKENVFLRSRVGPSIFGGGYTNTNLPQVTNGGEEK